MDKFVANAGNTLGVVGVVLTAAAGLARISGLFYIAGFEAMTLFVGGIGLMVMACFAKLHLLTTTHG